VYGLVQTLKEYLPKISMLKTLIRLTKSKITKLFLVGLGIFSLLTVPVFAIDQGLSIPDIEFIRAKIALAKGFISQFKPYFDDHIGKINLDFLGNTFLKDQFGLIAFSFLILLVLFDIIFMIIQQSNFKTFLPRFISSLVSSVAYVLIMTLANAFMGFVLNTNEGFTEFTMRSMDILNPSEDWASSVWNTLMSVIPIVSSTNITGPQTKLVIDILLGLYTVTPFIVGLSQVITDFIILTLFTISPLVAIFQIHGFKNRISQNFWSIFFDCIVAKIAFTVSYRIITEEINRNILTATGGLDIGKGFYFIALFIGMGAITLAIREVFNISGNYQVRSKVEHSSSRPAQVFQSSTNVISGGIQTVQSLRRGA
jgi:hypothetical protein